MIRLVTPRYRSLTLLLVWGLLLSAPAWGDDAAISTADSFRKMLNKTRSSAKDGVDTLSIEDTFSRIRSMIHATADLDETTRNDLLGDAWAAQGAIFEDLGENDAAGGAFRNAVKSFKAAGNTDRADVADADADRCYAAITAPPPEAASANDSDSDSAAVTFPADAELVVPIPCSPGIGVDINTAGEDVSVSVQTVGISTPIIRTEAELYGTVTEGSQLFIPKADPSVNFLE